MRSSGDVAQLRWVHDGRVSRVLPVVVVADDGRAVQLFARAGTPMRVRCGPNGEPIPRDLPYADRFSGPWRLGPGVWSTWHVLMLAAPGAAHGVWLVWDETWTFREWYVNLQRPLERTRFGFDVADHVLDVVVGSDLRWQWKDEHELEEAVRVGRFTRAEAEEVRREGERAVAAVEARAWPFDRDWSGWRPDPSWPEPRLLLEADEL
jgi:hypothetical protein